METTTRRRGLGVPLGTDVHVRFPESEAETITAEAAAGGYQSMSQYVRVLVRLGRRHAGRLSAGDRVRLLSYDGVADGRTRSARANGATGP